MDDFSFNESVEEDNGYNKDPNEKKKIIKFVIIVVVMLVVGFSVYFITDALINGNKKPTTVVTKPDKQMELSDEMIVYLYDNVSYAVNGVRNDKFFKSGKVTAEDFTNVEKFYYALRYAVDDDFVDMGPADGVSGAISGEESQEGSNDTIKDEKKEEDVPHTYSISNARIREYMFNFFGDSVTYTTSGEIPIAVNFLKNGCNAGNLKYDTDSDSFFITFDSLSEGGTAMAINPYLYKIESAMREGKTSNIIIKEKVVFTSSKQYTDEAGNFIDKYDCGIYKDYTKTELLEQKTGVTKSELSSLGIENYQENASIVTYTFFKDENDEYHFLSSEISN